MLWFIDIFRPENDLASKGSVVTDDQAAQLLAETLIPQGFRLEVVVAADVSELLTYSHTELIT